MSGQEKFLTLLAGCAQLQNKKLPPIVMELYLESFLKVGPELWLKALKEGVKAGRLPTIQEVEVSAGITEMTDEEAAKDAAERIWAAIIKFGWPNPGEAAGWMGDLAWSVVCAQGGWVNVCESANEDNHTYLLHLWAESAGRILKKELIANFTGKQLSASSFDAMKLIEQARMEARPASEDGTPTTGIDLKAPNSDLDRSK